ncbi:AbrB family transcriptional regulator [Streptococcus parauberis]|uniref:AbrB family transcriptional regulator n=1 Tax=Streptococcus parauberis TaxID=1348 RepID=UPI0037A724DC
MVIVFYTVTVGLLGGMIAKKLTIPAPFMIGSMLAVALLSVTTGQMGTVHSMKLFAQIISGAYIGQNVSKEDFLNLPKLGKAIAGLMTLFTLNMLVLGTILIVFFKMDAVTAFLSCLPGGIVDVSLMAIDMGAKADTVATMQTVRLVGILLILPNWVGFITNRFAPELRQIPRQQNESIKEVKELSLRKQNRLTNDMLILVISTIGGLIGEWSGLPVGALIISLLFSSALKIKRDTKQLHPYIRYIAQICAGSLIGCNFTHESFLQMIHLIIPIILLLSSYMIINGVFGYIMYKRGFLDIQSALFASSPAGATDISLLAGELGGDMPKIAGIQISRTLYTVIIMPLIIKLITLFI